MATETLYATGSLAGDVAGAENVLGAPDGSWTTTTGNTNWTHRWAMGDPVGGSLSGTQTVTLRVRKEVGQSGTPTVAANLYENGVLVGAIVGTANVNSTTGEDVSGTFDGSAISDASAVEVEVVGTSAGGNPSTRTALLLDAITWTANVEAVQAPSTAPTGLAAVPGDAEVALSWDTHGDATGYRVYRDGGGTPIYDGAAASYTDTAVSNGTTYSYTVSAYNSGGEGPESSAVNATPEAPPDPVDTEVRVSFPTPTTSLTGSQDFRVLVRRKEVSAPASDPTVLVELWEGGFYVADVVAATAVTSTSGEVVTGTWDASALADATGASVECRVVGTGSPGGTVEVGAIAWDLDRVEEEPPPEPEPDPYDTTLTQTVATDAATPYATADKPQSKTWVANGSWWAYFRDSSGTHRIWRWHGGSWVDYGAFGETRSGGHADVRWDGAALHVVSVPATGGIRYWKFAYDDVGDSWSETVAAVDLLATNVETVAVDIDSTGTLWAAANVGGDVRVAHTTTDHATWTTFTSLPGHNAPVADSIVGVVAFGGNAIGVLWDDQGVGESGFYFAIHADGDPDTTWTYETAWSGSLVGDDHLSPKALDGHVYAAVKTESDPADIVLLHRDPAGTWTNHVVASATSLETRPTLGLDAANGAAIVLMPVEGAGDGSLRMGVADLSDLSTWTLSVPHSGAGAHFRDPSTSKQGWTADLGGLAITTESTGSNVWAVEVYVPTPTGPATGTPDRVVASSTPRPLSAAPGGTSRAIGRVSASSTARPATATAGSTTATLSRVVATSTPAILSATPGATSGPVGRASVGSSARPVTATPGAVSAALGRVSAGSTPRPVDGAAGPASRDLPRVAATSTSRDVTGDTGPAATTLGRASATSDARDVTATPGATLTSLGRVAAASSPRDATATPGATSATAGRVASASTARGVSASQGAASADVDRASATSTARDLTAVPAGNAREVGRTPATSDVRDVSAMPGGTSADLPRVDAGSTARGLTWDASATRTLGRPVAGSTARDVSAAGGAAARELERVDSPSRLRTIGGTTGDTDRIPERVEASSTIRPLTATAGSATATAGRVGTTSAPRDLSAAPGPATRSVGRVSATGAVRTVTGASVGGSTRTLDRIPATSTARDATATPGTASGAIGRTTAGSAARDAHATPGAASGTIRRATAGSSARAIPATGTSLRSLGRVSATSSPAEVTGTGGTTTRIVSRVDATGIPRAATAAPGGTGRTVDRLSPTSTPRTLGVESSAARSLGRVSATSTTSPVAATPGTAPRIVDRLSALSRTGSLSGTSGTATKTLGRVTTDGTPRTLTAVRAGGPTPPERTYLVPAENRAGTVAYEDRTARVPYEDRTVTVSR